MSSNEEQQSPKEKEKHSSSMEKESQLKGGHAPAEKIAGGVRIARRERPHNETASGGEKSPTPEAKEGEEGAKADEDEERELVETSNVLAHSGLAAQTNKDYPEEAVRHTHEKIVPHHQFQSVPLSKQMTPSVFQPRRHQ